jgi:hypothetical protein
MEIIITINIYRITNYKINTYRFLFIFFDFLRLFTSFEILYSQTHNRIKIKNNSSTNKNIIHHIVIQKPNIGNILVHY